MKAQIYFQFKQWYDTKEGKKLGNTHALGNMTFPNQQEACNFLQEEIENMKIHEDLVQNWELVRVIQDVIPNPIQQKLNFPAQVDLMKNFKSTNMPRSSDSL
jgi:hypothetical protein